MFKERTDDEIVAFIEARIANPPFLFDAAVGDLLGFLPLERVMPYLVDDIDPAELEKFKAMTVPGRSEAELLGMIRQYLPFAWEKCRRQRGLSSIRNIQHFQAWTWMLGDMEAFEFLQDARNYEPYGQPMLSYLDEHYGGGGEVAVA